MAADPFRTAKIGVIWNMDGCPIPPVFSDVTQIAPQIKLVLSILGYEGEVHIGAIGDTRKLDLKIIRDMRVTGIVVEHSDSDEYPNGKHIMAHMYDWPMCNRGANILNISTDTRFLEDLCILGRKGFNILRVERKSADADAKYLWDWSDILNVVSQRPEANLLPDYSGQGQYNQSWVQQKPWPWDSGFPAPAKWPWEAGDVEPSLSWDSGFPAPAKWPWEAGDVEPSLSQCSSVYPNLFHDSDGETSNNRDGNGQFGEYRGEQAAAKQPNTNTYCARQPQSRRKHR